MPLVAAADICTSLYVELWYISKIDRVIKIALSICPTIRVKSAENEGGGSMRGGMYVC